MTAREISEALGGKKVGPRYVAPCPAHADSKPSLHITDGHSQVLVVCRAGCDKRDVIKALIEMGVWEKTPDNRPQLDFKELRKAQLWRQGMLPVLDSRLEKIGERITGYLERDQDPSMALQAACRENTALRLKLIDKDLSGMDLITAYRQAKEQDAALVNRCVSWAINYGPDAEIRRIRSQAQQEVGMSL